MTRLEQVSAVQKVLDGKETIQVPAGQTWPEWIGDIAANHDHWLSYAFRGFRILQERGFTVNHFVSIGTGSGIDAIGAMEILRPQTVTVTDLAPSILKRAEENIAVYQENGGQTAQISYSLGSLCEPLVGQTVDLIYANLPNLPVPPKLKNKLLENGVSAAYFDPDMVSGVPEKFERHLLTLQYAFLLQSRDHLTDRGRILLNLGVRMPLDLVSELFVSAGFMAEALVFGLKLQTRPLQSIASYAANEDGGRFIYYPFTAAGEAAAAAPVHTATELVSRLQPLQLSSAQALKLAESGESIGYLAVLFCAGKNAFSKI